MFELATPPQIIRPDLPRHHGLIRPEFVRPTLHDMIVLGILPGMAGVASRMVGEGGVTQIDVDVTPGQTFTASQTHVSTNISRLFDDNPVTEWGNGTDDTFWVTVQFSAPKAIWKYTLTANVTDFDRMPISWTYEASPTGSFAGEEVTLDTQTTVSAWSSGEKRDFSIPNTTPYLHYRLTGTAKTNALGKNEEYVLSEMEMMAFG